MRVELAARAYDILIGPDLIAQAAAHIARAAPGSACAIVDSVLDYDPKSGRTRTTSADKVIG